MVKVYGYGVPVKFNNLRKGLVVYIHPSADEKYLGVITKNVNDWVVVVLASSAGSIPPFLIDAAAVISDMWSIDGNLEIEPKDGEFVFVKDTSSTSEKIIIDSSGDIFAVVKDNDYSEWRIIHLASGEHADGSNHEAVSKPVAVLTDFAIFIRQEGRDQRFTLTL